MGAPESSSSSSASSLRLRVSLAPALCALAAAVLVLVWPIETAAQARTWLALLAAGMAASAALSAWLVGAGRAQASQAPLAQPEQQWQPQPDSQHGSVAATSASEGPEDGLGKVARVAGEVAETTASVRGMSDLATRAAAREQREVALAARELDAAAHALVAVAERAREADEASGRAVRTTVAAVGIVRGAVEGVVRSRELIRETEKRVKRLGERSQEIGQVVGIIEGISQRTGILALNASMHAAAAGEAGRSFATVADEIGRLAESARDGTARIGRLVHAIQTESGQTVVAMNQAITRVVEVSRMADAAGEQMRLTQQETEALAANVRDIAATSDEQARASSQLRERAAVIQESSAETARQLTAQNIETRRLVEAARTLTSEVGALRTGLRP